MAGEDPRGREPAESGGNMQDNQTGRFWYSQKQAAILEGLGKTLNVCRVPLCGEPVEMGYTCLIPEGDPLYDVYEPEESLEAVPLGEGVLVQINQDAEGWDTPTIMGYLGATEKPKYRFGFTDFKSYKRKEED
jgi:hypothetical protein